MPQFKKQKPRKGDATPYTKVKIGSFCLVSPFATLRTFFFDLSTGTPFVSLSRSRAAPIAQKAHSSALVADAHKVFQKERAKIDATIEAFMVHKAVKDGAVFKVRSAAVSEMQSVRAATLTKHCSESFVFTAIKLTRNRHQR
jgi:hypothetical protein